jgi:hypothetical protein
VTRKEIEMSTDVSGVGGSVFTQRGGTVDKSPAADFEIEEGTAGSSEDMKYYLEMMMKVQAETRAYESLSNVIKAKHEAMKTSIANSRG